MAFGDHPDDKPLHDAWHSFCEKLKLAGDKVFKDANHANELQRADGFRFLTQNLGQAFDLSLETKDPAYPQFHPFVTPNCKLGGDVADFTYRQAWIDGDHTYKISGRRGTARWFNLTVQGPRPETIPGTDWPSLHEPFGDIPECNILGSHFKPDTDGNFELFIGGDKQGDNWLPTTAGSRKLFVREAFDAWGETPTSLTIECMDMQSPRPMTTPDEITEAMQWAGNFLTGAMTDWPEHSWQYSGGVCDPNLVNQFPPDKTANTQDDAKRGRMAAHMIWQLEKDEALIVEMDMHDGFWIFGMGGAFIGSMDFLYRPVSYTPARTAVDTDNVVRLVIAHTDPGIHNWLDTQGFTLGNLTYRNLLSQSSATFRTQLIRQKNLWEYLPRDTVKVSEKQRTEMLRERYRAIKLRYGT